MRGKKINWEPWMVEYLTEHYARDTNAEIAEHLGMGKETVFRKAAELGLKKDWKALCALRARRSGAARRGKIYPHSFQPGRHPETQFQPGHKESEETRAARSEAIRRGMLRRVYSELVRMKYGLPRETRLRINPKMHIDKEKYLLKDDGDDK